MDRIRYLNLLLEEVGGRDGIVGLRLAPDGTGGLALQNGARVYFEYVDSTDRLYVYSTLRPLPESDAERLRLFDAMLAANFDQPEAGSLAIAHGHAVYRTAHPARDLDANRLDDAIDHVLKRRDAMSRHLDLPPGPEAGPAPQAASTSTLLHRRRVLKIIQQSTE
jgi:hypothetical protein